MVFTQDHVTMRPMLERKNILQQCSSFDFEKRCSAFLTGMKGVRWMPRLLRSEEGRGMAAISLGKVPSNRYNRGCPNGETLLSTIEI